MSGLWIVLALFVIFFVWASWVLHARSRNPPTHDTKPRDKGPMQGSV
jgi:hypothetical protein